MLLITQNAERASLTGPSCAWRGDGQQHFDDFFAREQMIEGKPPASRDGSGYVAHTSVIMKALAMMMAWCDGDDWAKVASRTRRWAAR